MHRFRKKSDAKKPYGPQIPATFDVQHAPGGLPELPPASDFRTSLILPDLSRRFSVLRSSSGEPVSIDALRNKLAEQRARGAENQVTEEEEDMIFESLGFRSRAATPSKSQENVSEPPPARSNRRYSNNLFGSSKFRDNAYIRNVSSKASSRVQSGASASTTDSDIRSAPPSGPDQVSLGRSAYKRASMALEQAINELEEDEEGDEVVLPRSAPIMRSSIDQRRSPDPIRSMHPRSFEASGMAISSDDRRASPIPSKVMPGYIPGMPRPMTPRELDSDEQRSYSTTPRAASPNNVLPSRIDSSSPSFSSSVMSSFMRPDPPALVSQSPVPYSATPLFLQRSPNGRHTPEDRALSSEIAIDFDQSLNSSILGRRRAASPLSASSTGGSRPGTPSNTMAWPQPPSSPMRHGHNRNGSWFSDGGSSEVHITSTHDQSNSKNPGRSLKSPALPDSPLIDNGPSQYSLQDKRPTSPMSTIELGASVVTGPRVVRSGTPTHDYSATTFSANGGSPRSARSSRQQTSTQFSLDSLQPLVFSPLANSSRSSLESVGSSYHSWDGTRKESIVSLFNDSDPQQPAWYDVSVSDQSSSITPGASLSLDEDAEAIIQDVGLKRSDFLAIHNKLVQVASTKSIPSDMSPHRVPSLRRRRPSTSQSTYSYNGNGRIASPPPQPLGSPLNSSSPAVDTSKRDVVSDSSDDSSPTRKTKAIAHLLFGADDSDPKAPQPSELTENDTSFISFSYPKEPLLTPPAPTTPSLNIPNSLYSTSRNPSMPRLPQTPKEEAELTKEVERRAHEAILALKGGSQSNINVSAGLVPSSNPKKRISPHQISTPTLVSASTSVDTIPLRSPPIPIPISSSIKISRFKKLKGSLRKPTNLPTGEEVTPFPLDLQSPNTDRGAPNHRHANDPYNTSLSRDNIVPMPMSAVESRFKVPIPSPPASAGPGLKGFMARFRSKPRTIDPSLQYANRQSPQPPSLSPVFPENGSASMSKSQWGRLTPSSPTNQPQIHDESQYGDSMGNLSTPRGQYSALLSPEPNVSPATGDESLALKQLFHAAQNLGIDEKRLNDLVLVRSGSTSSKSTTWTSGLDRSHSKSLARSNTLTTLSHNKSTVSALSRNNSVTLAQSSNLKRNNSSVTFNQPEGYAESSKADADINTRSARKPVPDHIRRPREGVDSAHYNSAVVRRTIIVPAEFRNPSAFDLNALTNTKASNRRRASTTSTSSRSIQDRVPTPPPPRSGSRRVSKDGFPPVPQLPNSPPPPTDSRLKAPGLEPSNSNYDSLFDMYTGDAKAHGGQTLAASSNGANQVLEVLELANGETIWSIVNGLRDDDAESEYGGRTSMESEYDGPDDEMQVYVKEHKRNGSSNSNYKPTKPTTRPETKVFYSSSAHIGRLIENLSQGMESGSFNFRNNHPPLHSTTSSMTVSDADGTWTVEERLDHMLGSMERSG